jgi:acetoacetyl-CoA synthetase
VIATDESGGRTVHSFAQLRADVARHQQSLSAAGIVPGDVVAAILPNRYEAVVAMLAAASLGATWCSVSPDFGVSGILDRLGQVHPKVIYACRRYRYGERDFDITDKLQAVLAGLPDLQCTVLTDVDPGPLQGVPLETFLPAASVDQPRFVRLPFAHNRRTSGGLNEKGEAVATLPAEYIGLSGTLPHSAASQRAK